MIDKKLKAELFFGYTMYVKKKGAEAVRAGLNPNKVVKFLDYLTEELNYTLEEAKVIQKEITKDSIDEKSK